MIKAAPTKRSNPLISIFLAGAITNTALWFFGDLQLGPPGLLQVFILSIALVAGNGVRTSFLAGRLLALLASLGTLTLSIWWIVHLNYDNHRQPLEVWHVVGTAYTVLLLIVATRVHHRT